MGNVNITGGTEDLPLLSRQQIHDRIESLAVSADAKAILFEIAETTINVGSALVHAGRKILSFVFDLANRFPNTAFGALIGFVLSALLTSVPVLGPILGALLGPLLIALGIGAGAVADLGGQRAFVSRVEKLERDFLNPSSKHA